MGRKIKQRDSYHRDIMAVMALLEAIKVDPYRADLPAELLEAANNSGRQFATDLLEIEKRRNEIYGHKQQKTG